MAIAVDLGAFFDFFCAPGLFFSAKVGIQFISTIKEANASEFLRILKSPHSWIMPVRCAIARGIPLACGSFGYYLGHLAEGGFSF